MNNFYTGAIIDTIDERDYSYDMIGHASAPFDWDKGYDVEESVGVKIAVKDQKISSSCGGQAWAYSGQVLDVNDLDEKSAKFIYAHTHVPGGGSAGRTNCEHVKTKGWATEKICPSYPATEENLINTSDITKEAYSEALTDTALSYGTVSYDIELLAQAIRDNKGVVLGVTGQNNGTWRSQFPKAPNGSTETWNHWLYAGKAKIINGKKYIGILNSWGDEVGSRGWQWLDEGHMNYLFGAWTLIYKTQAPVQFVFPRVLKIGMRGKDVEKLQEKLGIKVDGIFGKITELKVKNFQSLHGLKPDGIVGKLTVKALLTKI